MVKVGAGQRKVISLSCAQPVKTLSLISVTLVGMVSFVRRRQPLKASVGMLLRLVESVMLSKLLLAKAAAPISSTELGRVRLLSFSLYTAPPKLLSLLPGKMISVAKVLENQSFCVFSISAGAVIFLSVLLP